MNTVFPTRRCSYRSRRTGRRRAGGGGMSNVIEIRGVSKSFGGVRANVDISLDVPDGRITGLIGPNGSVKTTLFNSIVGYHPIDGGRSEEHTSELQSLMRNSYAVFCVKKKNRHKAEKESITHTQQIEHMNVKKQYKKDYKRRTIANADQ